MYTGCTKKWPSKLDFTIISEGKMSLFNTFNHCLGSFYIKKALLRKRCFSKSMRNEPHGLLASEQCVFALYLIVTDFSFPLL